MSPRTNQRIPMILVQRVNVKKELSLLKRATFKNRNGFEPEITKSWKPVVNADPGQILKEVFAPPADHTEGCNDKENHGSRSEQEEEQPAVAIPPDPVPEIDYPEREQKVNPLTGFPESFDVGIFEPDNDVYSSGGGGGGASPPAPRPLPMSDFIRCSYCDKMDTKQKIWQHTIMEHSKS